MKKYYYYTILFLLMYTASFSQETVNCDNGIEAAEELYNSGKYDECINYLENLLNTCKLTKNKKSKAYEILINSNLEKDSISGVETFFRKFLENNPVYNIKDYNGIDEFVSNYEKYYVYPKLSIGIKPYYSLPFFATKKAYSVLGNTDYSKKYEVDKVYNASLAFDYRLREKIGIYAEAGFYQMNIKRTLSSDYWLMTYNEKTKQVILDLGLKYFFNTHKKLSYYVSVGYSNNYLLKSTTSYSQEKYVTDPFSDIRSTSKRNLDNINTTSARKKYIGMVGAGAGLSYRIGRFGFGLDIRYSTSLSTFNDPYERFLQYQTIRDYNYVDNDIKLSKLNLGLTINYYLKFKTNKLK